MPAPPTNPDLLNPGLEAGTTTGWTITQFGGVGTPAASTERPYSGVYSALWTGAAGTGHAGGVEATWFNDAEGTVYPGQTVQAQAQIALKDTGSSQNRGEVRLYWYDASSVLISFTSGNLIRGNNSSYRLSSVSATPPSGAVFVKMAVWTTANASGGVLFDEAAWTYDYDRTVTLTSPLDAAEYGEGDNVSLTVTIGGTTPPITGVTYFTGVTPIGSSTSSPYSFNTTTLAAGAHAITAEVAFTDGTTITSAAANITVTATPVPPTTREFKASNSYTYLVAGDFIGLASAIPSTALVTGVEMVFDYAVRALIRSKDTGIPDPEGSNPNVAFDITDGGVIETILLTQDGSSYSESGTAVTGTIPLIRSDFTVIEEGLSEDKKWTVMDSVPASATIGDETSLFGSTSIALADFLDMSIGVRFYPELLPKPSYADSGDMCFRFFINSMRLRVYFDAGSAEYYFASPDKTQIIKGTLIASCIDSGDLRTSDAAGTLQLSPELEIVAGTQTFIGGDWTIHAATPPTDANQIGTVTERIDDATIGMSYNGLPSAQAVVDNRSRYEFITANFFADKDLDSIYGVHGLPRAFAYNGDFFYKICTQPDPIKDSPRHVAYHHGHLALGFDEGRVDISVIGQPYNFDGALGASSWSIGDKVNGLLPLSGTILGVFGSKSIWGISGTTVDNFATQVISPNIGAIEYTVCDMGDPVYANAYGIYTLAQTERYGDYLGSPMSKDISPWIRPRLARKYTSDKEVVVAWPVRSKNQYRLAFSDGYVLSMTLNGESVPTFSFQNYIIYSEADE